MKELPPVVQILADENLRVLADPRDAYAALKKGLFKELKRQAAWTRENYDYVVDTSGTSVRFEVTPTGIMNPLSSGVGCDSVRCRTQRARTFAQTLGLWADRIYLADMYSAKFFDPGRLSVGWAETFSRDVAILRELLPLVQANVVQFGDPVLILCKKCTNAAINKATRELVESFADTFEFRKHQRPGWLRISSPIISEDAVIRYPVPAEKRAAAAELVVAKRARTTRGAAQLRRAIVRELLRDKVEDVLLDLHSAQEQNSALVSATRADVLCLHALEKKAPELGSAEEWEQPREVSLPWVNQLSAHDVIRLRHEAASALPRLREMIISSVTTGEDSAASIKKTIGELRAQAAEVESELAAISVRRRRKDKAALALVSAGLALYGFGAAGMSAVAAAGQLFTTLGMIHGFSRTDHAEEAKLKARPGYVLLKARELLATASHAQHAG